MKVKENKNVLSAFRQPVIPDETLSGLTDLGQGSSADLTRGMVNRPGTKQQFIPDQIESGLAKKPPTLLEDLVRVLSKKEAKPQVEQSGLAKKPSALVEDLVRVLSKKEAVDVQPFRQPVIPDNTLSGLTDLGQKSGADLTRGMINRPGIKQQFIPDQVESGLVEEPPTLLEDLVRVLGKKEIRPQVEQLVDQPVSDEDRKSTRLNSSHSAKSRMPSSA